MMASQPTEDPKPDPRPQAKPNQTKANHNHNLATSLTEPEAGNVFCNQHFPARRERVSLAESGDRNRGGVRSLRLRLSRSLREIFATRNVWGRAYHHEVDLTAATGKLHYLALSRSHWMTTAIATWEQIRKERKNFEQTHMLSRHPER
ncbi:uncharacterized protein LOC117186669 [Drosophila miranda]|uniref:uncharacterized protein LOC117186669 n=1 Tax=Drosophila miranda TaxID=7229 RepID=UPI00143F4175|nr:uncharacterized protein LOC117186669 [Drosophila miranda]